MTGMTMMVMAMMGVMVGVVGGQPVWPPAPDFTWRQDMIDEVTDIVSADKERVRTELFRLVVQPLVDRNLYKQLYVSNDELKDACEKMYSYEFVKSGGALAPHPRSCSFVLKCAATMLNPFRVDTIYMYEVQVVELSAGTYYNPDTHTVVIWNANNQCAADPCKTGRSIPGRKCNEYLSCEKNAGGQNVLVKNTCPAGQGFSIYTRTCQPDASCTVQNITSTTDLYCNYTGLPAGREHRAGIPDSAYYNRTYRIDGTNQIVTIEQECPSGMVFDPSDPKSTVNCLCKRADQVVCRNHTLINAGVKAAQSWTQAINLEAFNVTIPSSGPHRHWASFVPNVDFNYFDAQALAKNELSGDWVLNFGFQLADNGNPSNVVLAENSHTLRGCPSPSLIVSVFNSNSIRAQVNTKYIGNVNIPITVEVTNPSGVSLSAGKTDVVLERKANQLVLRVLFPGQSQYQEDAGDLGDGPLKSTRCGLIFGQHFNGWLESVRLIKYGC